MFWIKNKKNGKIHDRAYELAADLGLGIFRPHEVVVNEDGDVYILNTMDDVFYLNMDEIEIVWNIGHPFFENMARVIISNSLKWIDMEGDEEKELRDALVLAMEIGKIKGANMVLKAFKEDIKKYGEPKTNATALWPGEKKEGL